VAIGSRALDVLCALAAHPGEVVSKRQIMDAVWPDMAVQEKNLTMQVSALRQVLEREGGRGWIQTIPGRGYRLVAPLGGTDAQDGPLARISHRHDNPGVGTGRLTAGRPALV
jgi:DNA-binding winged helix-turn-helix (wHTH) protein